MRVKAYRLWNFIFTKNMSENIIGKYGLKFRYCTKNYLTGALKTV